ncbi:hypothetical protein POTOM_051219 [Populus tomentosa]|uniref:Uncharacterized protein n=1 Tax=Populus tomentosa TaxID=118781 RepID=A0A8X7Y1N4_POPTO|nr:hypothetical protein POTOM_051219 [Populus tomentosa]
MSQNQATVAYPPPPASTGPSAYSAPPPAGYPTMDGQTYQQDPIPVETKSRGDGFWKGCISASHIIDSSSQTGLYMTVKHYRRRITYLCCLVLLLCLGHLLLRIDGVSCINIDVLFVFCSFSGFLL